MNQQEQEKKDDDFLQYLLEEISWLLYKKSEIRKYLCAWER